MKEILIDELKSLQIDILADVHNFCVNNGIEYSLAYGTLLGAVRHKGYIPWDDDIDIMMRRDDYENFIKIYHHDYYSVVDTSTSIDYYLPFAKICDDRTMMIEQSTQKKPIGVYVDVFPVDNIPDSDKELDRMFLKKKCWNIVYMLKIVAIDRNRSLYKNLILAMSHFLLVIIPMKLVVSKMKSISKRYQTVTTNRRAVFVFWNNMKRWVLPKALFDRYSEITFEGMTYKTISEVDTYLKAMYGDYMQLPPEDKRVSHHSFKAYWKE